jgi:uncharacterized protein YciI
MKTFALFYDVVGGFATKRQVYREEHLGLVHAAHDRGELVMAGALGDPPDGALLVFRAPDVSIAEAFAKHDPYVINGLVTAWRVRPWNVVTGESADRRPM